jgi:hypothetical protein
VPQLHRVKSVQSRKVHGVQEFERLDEGLEKIFSHPPSQVFFTTMRNIVAFRSLFDEDRTFKLASGTTFGYGRYVKFLSGGP